MPGGPAAENPPDESLVVALSDVILYGNQRTVNILGWIIVLLLLWVLRLKGLDSFLLTEMHRVDVDLSWELTGLGKDILL